MEWSGKLQTHSSEWAELHGPIPSQQQQTTALIILGMIGAEFHSGDRSTQSKRKQSVDHKEVMDHGVARRTGRTLQVVLLEKPHGKSPLHSNLRCSAAELLGRGFQLWEKYIDIPQVGWQPGCVWAFIYLLVCVVCVVLCVSCCMYRVCLLLHQVVMGLLDLLLQYVPPSSSSEAELVASRRSSRLKFTSEVARKALNLMIILRPVTMVTTLAKEVSTYLASQHVTNYPHSSIQPMQVC